LKENKYIIFVDFDGTVTTRDVGDGIFDRFLRNDLEDNWHENLLEEWKSGRITSHECLVIQGENSAATEDEMIIELDNYPLRAGFAEFLQYCKINGIHVEILSDGLDFYINHILNKHGLGWVPVKANHMHFEGSKMVIEFPFIGIGCGHCGNCKRSHVQNVRQNGDKVIYIGDGYSDRFAVKSSDMVFARGDLARHCKRDAIPFTYFEDFNTVLKFMEKSDE
jgi:2-hydroxy-3-keto-5-methylthiopentenyl-1-phosphate phosphatase